MNGEVAALREENAGLKAEVTRPEAAWDKALAWIAELEERPICAHTWNVTVQNVG